MSTPTPTAPAAPAPTAPSAPTAPAPAVPAAPPTPPTPATAPSPTDAQDVASLPPWAQSLIQSTRAEAAGYRTRAQAAEQGQPPQAPPAPQPPAPAPADPPEGDVSRLPRWAQTAVTAAQGASRQLAVQTAVIAAAPAAGADVAALLDSQAAMTALAQVDPSDPAAVAAAITAAVQANPRLAATSGAARGGADFGATGTAPLTAAQFAAMSYPDRVALHQSDPDTYRRLAGS